MKRGKGRHDERRLGELIREQKETVGLNVGKRGDRGPRAAPRSDTRPTLAEAGIDKKLSSRAQKETAGPAQGRTRPTLRRRGDRGSNLYSPTAPGPAASFARIFAV